jgi:hypothetical protein
MNVATSTKKFLGALGPLSSWQMKTNWKGCQDVQRSAFSDGRNYQANDAYKTGTTVALLVALNQGSYPSLAHNPGVIEIGWKPRLTGAAQAAPKTPANPPQRVYVVQSGDNLRTAGRWRRRSCRRQLEVASPSLPNGLDPIRRLEFR